MTLGLTRSQTQSELYKIGGRRITSLADARKSVDRKASREKLLLAKDITEQVANAVEGWNNLKKKELETIEECRPGKQGVVNGVTSVKTKPHTTVAQGPVKKGQTTGLKEVGPKPGVVSPPSKLKQQPVSGVASVGKKTQSSGTSAQASSGALITKQSALAELTNQKEFDIDKAFKDLEDLKVQMETVAPNSARPQRGSAVVIPSSQRGVRKVPGDTAVTEEESPQKGKPSEGFTGRRPTVQIPREHNTNAKKPSIGMAPTQAGMPRNELGGELSNMAKKSAMVKNKKYLDEIEGLAQALFSKIGELQRENGWSIKIEPLKREYAKTLDILKGEVIKKS